MNDLEVRLRVHGLVQQWIDSFMISNGVSASTMEDALSKVLLGLKDKAVQEFIESVTAQIQPEPAPVSFEIREEEEEQGEL